MSDVELHSLRRRCVVTTPTRATDEQVDCARKLANWFDATYVPREGRGFEYIREKYGANLVIVADNPVKLYHEDAETALFFHPSMARQRIIRLARGESDRLLKAAEICPGDVIVDATLGLASDSLVFAYAAGLGGKVVGLEAMERIARMLQFVQQHVKHPYEAEIDLLRRVEIVHANHLAWLSAQPDESVDVIYFDPMFRIPEEASASVAPLRAFADATPLSQHAVEEAKRVARRSVIVKERLSSGIFEQHGLVPDYLRRKWAYGVWRKRG